MHAIACSAKHAKRRVCILRLEVIVERIDEQYDVCIVRVIANRHGTTQEWIATPARQRTARCDTERVLAEPCGSGNAIAKIRDAVHSRRPRRPARQLRKPAVATRDTVNAHPVMQHLDLHLRHVDAGRTFAAAAFAAHA